MLDQRRAEEKGFITLKEAAKIANYTPDYVGQLIRAGKIRGEQVYSQVAWVTTPDEIQAYLDDKSRTVSHKHSYFAVLKDLSSFTLYLFIGLCAVAIILTQYVLFVSLNTTAHVEPQSNQTNVVTMYTR